MSLYYVGKHELQKLCLFSHIVSWNDTAVACYIFDSYQPIVMVFGR